MLSKHTQKVFFFHTQKVLKSVKLKKFKKCIFFFAFTSLSIIYFLFLYSSTLGVPDSIYARFNIVSNTCYPAPCYLNSNKVFLLLSDQYCDPERGFEPGSFGIYNQSRDCMAPQTARQPRPVITQHQFPPKHFLLTNCPRVIFILLMT